MANVRVAAVRFLNAAPLWWGFRSGILPDGWDLDYAVPSACAAKLLSGEVDLALMPSVELCRQPGLAMAAPLCIAAERESGSVLLLCGSPLDKIERVILDPASRSSQALARIIFKERGKPGVAFEEEAYFELPLQEGLAALVIGDRAMKMAGASGVRLVADLPVIWAEMTGLPFVFAAWACRAGDATADLAGKLEDSYSYGCARSEEIVKTMSAEIGLNEDDVRDYLTRRLHYRLGERERESLALFHKKVGRLVT